MASRHLVFGGETAEAGPIRKAMDRAAKCCLAWLNAEQEILSTGGYEVTHDTGRWWDAMLRFEAATGTRCRDKDIMNHCENSPGRANPTEIS